MGQALGADVHALLEGIYTDQMFCWEDVEGAIRLLKSSLRALCGETQMEMLTLSGDQKWAAELGLALMS